MPRTSCLNGDPICLFAAAILAVIATTACQAAPLNHDRQHVVLRDRVDLRHDRAPCPSQIVTPG